MRHIHSHIRASRVPAVPAVPPPLPAAAGAVRASAPRDALERAATRAARRGDERAHRAVRARMASNKRARATPTRRRPRRRSRTPTSSRSSSTCDGVAAGPELDLPPDVGRARIAVAPARAASRVERESGGRRPADDAVRVLRRRRGGDGSVGGDDRGAEDIRGTGVEDSVSAAECVSECAR